MMSVVDAVQIPVAETYSAKQQISDTNNPEQPASRYH